VSGQLDLWLSAQRIEPSTRAGYEAAARFWKGAPCDESGRSLGAVALRTVRLSHLLRALASRPSLSGKTVNNYVSVLREALQLAVADRLLAENPAAAVPRAKHQKDPPDPFDADERERILARLAERHPGHVHNLVAFWFWTGLRTSEVFGLRWPNIDLAAGKVRVAEASVRGQHKATTKTATARDVLLNPLALAALERQRQHTFLAAQEVFRDPRAGKAWSDERAFRRSYWTPTLKALGIRYRRPYQMRHTYATALLMAPGGMVNPAFGARQLGHSVEMFLQTYSRWIDGAADRNELAKLGLSPACPQAETASAAS
jgi:integrase